MPKYFLHIKDGQALIEDPDGADYPNPAAAHAEAVQGARDILAQQLKNGIPLDGHAIEIRDETGALCETVLFRDVYRAM